jgi:hypothetical protein
VIVLISAGDDAIAVTYEPEGLRNFFRLQAVSNSSSNVDILVIETGNEALIATR